MGLPKITEGGIFMKLKLKGKFWAMSMLPLLLATIIIAIIMDYRISGHLETLVKNNLYDVAVMERDNISLSEGNSYRLDQDGNLWNGDHYNISEDTELIDTIKKNNKIETSIFYGNTRCITTLQGSSNDTTGNKADPKVTDVVLKKGEEGFFKNISILGQKCYGIYIPYYDDNSDEPVGMVFAGMQSATIRKMVTDIMAVIVLIMLILVILSAICSWILSGQITGRIAYGVKNLGEIADGNLTNPIDTKYTKSTDETGELVRSVVNLQQKLSEIVGNISSESDVVQKSAQIMDNELMRTKDTLEQIEQAVAEIADGATSQAADAQLMNNDVIFMGERIQETNDNIEKIHTVANHMEKNSLRAKNTLQELEDINTEVKQSIQVISQQTDTTNESAQRIEEAINLITTIAEETNLLSLNASIEAARAGEQGRGFAVVASQIQKLAEQSNESAQQIGESITVLLKDSENAVITMEHVKEVMNKQNQMLQDTKNVFDIVAEDINASRKEIGRIAQNSEELDKAREQVVDRVRNISDVSERYAASTEETSASTTEMNTKIQKVSENANQLKTVSDNLKENVHIFKL